MNLNQIIENISLSESIPLSEAKEYTLKHLEVLIQKENALLESEIKKAITERAEFEEKLFSGELEKLKKEDHENFIAEIISLYECFSIYPTEKITNRFSELGLPEKKLKWFIPIHKITAELNKINKHPEIKIKIFGVIDLIQTHLYFKIANDIQTWANLVGKKRSGKTYNALHNRYVDIFRRIDYQTQQKSSGQFEVLNSTQGKTEKNTLYHIIDQHTYYTCSDRELYSTLFDFFKLLLPGSNLLSEEEFIGSNRSEKYDAKYRVYQYNTLKKILNSSSKKMTK